MILDKTAAILARQRV